jgi:hypothetical protein
VSRSTVCLLAADDRCWKSQSTALAKARDAKSAVGGHLVDHALRIVAPDAETDGEGGGGVAA